MHLFINYDRMVSNKFVMTHDVFSIFNWVKLSWIFSMNNNKPSIFCGSRKVDFQRILTSIWTTCTTNLTNFRRGSLTLTIFSSSSSAKDRQRKDRQIGFFFICLDTFSSHELILFRPLFSHSFHLFYYSSSPPTCHPLFLFAHVSIALLYSLLSSSSHLVTATESLR